MFKKKKKKPSQRLVPIPLAMAHQLIETMKHFWPVIDSWHQAKQDSSLFDIVHDNYYKVCQWKEGGLGLHS